MSDIRHIRSDVYEPLVDYYVRNREKLKCLVLNVKPSHLKNVTYDLIENIAKSLLKMKELSQRKILDYILIKATPA